MINIKSELVLLQMGANNIFCWSGAYDKCVRLAIWKKLQNAINDIFYSLKFDLEIEKEKMYNHIQPRYGKIWHKKNHTFS